MVSPELDRDAAKSNSLTESVARSGVVGDSLHATTNAPRASMVTLLNIGNFGTRAGVAEVGEGITSFTPATPDRIGRVDGMSCVCAALAQTRPQRRALWMNPRARNARLANSCGRLVISGLTVNVE